MIYPLELQILARERIAPYRKDVLARSGKTVGGASNTRTVYHWELETDELEISAR